MEDHHTETTGDGIKAAGEDDIKAAIKAAENSTQERIAITSISEIRMLVDTFYGKVQQDQLIGPIFDRVIQNNWPTHLAKMYKFWQTVLLNEHTYHGTPFLPHMNLPISKPHFQRWISIFNETVDELFEGEVAEEAKWRANKMADMFMHKLDFYQKNRQEPLI